LGIKERSFVPVYKVFTGTKLRSLVLKIEAFLQTGTELRSLVTTKE